MKYTKYFSAVIRDQGLPQFTPEQFKKFMNIVFLEGKVSGVKFQASKLPQLKDVRFNVHTFHVEQKLTEITRNFDPKECLERLLNDTLY